LLDGAHPALESTIEPVHKRKSLHAVGGGQEIPQHVAYRTQVIARCNPEGDPGRVPPSGVGAVGK
jgi:hypothetical protein